MPRLWFFILFLSLGLVAFSQSIQALQRLGSINTGAFQEELIAEAIMLNDGSVYAVGTYAGGTALFGQDTVQAPSSVNSLAGFICKYNNAGDLEWHKPVFGAYDCEGWQLAIDTSGNVIATFTLWEEAEFDSISLTNVPRGTILTTKYSSDGDLLWYTTFESNGQGARNNAIALEVNSVNEILICGRYDNILYIDNDTLFELQSGSYNRFFLAKMAEDGTVIWSKILQENGASSPKEIGDIAIDQVDNFYLIAPLDSVDLDGDTTRGEDGLAAIVKYNTNGDLIWSKDLGFFSNEGYGLGIENFEGDLAFFISNSTAANGGGFFYDTAFVDSTDCRGTAIGKIDTSGNLLWVDLVQSNSSSVNAALSINDIAAQSGKLFFVGDSDFDVIIGDLEISNSNNLINPIAFTYIDSTNSYQTLIQGEIQAGESSSKAIAANIHGDYVIGGEIQSVNTLSFDTHQVTIAGSKDGFILKVKSCDYMATNIQNLSGDTVLCSNSNILLGTTSVIESVDYQWLYGASAIIGQTDTIYNVQVPGSYSLQMSDSVCQVITDPITITNGSTQTVGFPMAQTVYCAGDAPVALSSGTPSGGVYAGPGVSGGVFYPSNAGLGTKNLYYIYTQTSGCVDSVLQTVEVNSVPTVFFFQTINACDNDTVTLNGGLPSGGVYSGLGVTTNQFLAQTAGTGSHNLVYTYTNSSGCSNTDTITAVVNPSPNVAFSWSVDSTCENASPIAFDGFAPSGGTFSGTGVSGNYFIPSIVDPNEYVISYSVDSGGCTSVARDTIQVDSFPDVILQPLDSICLSATSYVLDHGYPAGGNFSGTGITNNVFDASVAGIGTHTVRYIFENSCAADTAYSTITVIASPTITATATHVSCNGLTDGSIVASANGGSGPYTYQWSTGDSVAIANNLSAGTYSVTASGDGGCMVSGSFSVTEPAVLQLLVDSTVNVNCNGFNDGEAYVNTSGGAASYTHQWSNGSSTEDVLNLSAGMYAVTVTDAKGCQDSLTITIDQDNPITLSTSRTDISCTGSDDGTATTIASGGGGSFTYTWSSGSTNTTATGLAPGETVVTVTDQNNCEAIDTVNILEPDSLVVSLSKLDVDCFGDNDATATSSVIGGRTPYSYAWSTGGNTGAISSLAAGTYTITVTDSSGCISMSSTTINQPDSITIMTQIQEILCAGDSNGGINANGFGGTGNITYSWSTGSAFDSIGGLMAGNYTVTATDSSGCINTKSITLVEPAFLSADLSITSPKQCFGDSSATLLATTTGGTGALSYSWNTSDTTNSAYNLTAGTYTVTIIDSVACTASDSFEVTDPAEMILDILTTNVLCFGDSNGSATVSVANNNGPVTYLWSNAETNTNVSNLWADTYTILVTDSAGCSKVDSMDIAEPTALSLQLYVDSVLCFGDSNGSIEADVSGGTASYAYVWTNGVTEALNDSLFSGIYGLTITDSNGCELTDTIILSNPDSIQITSLLTTSLTCFGDSNGSATIVASTGNDSLFYSWSDGDTSDTRNDLIAASYTVTISDENGCSVDSAFTITSPTEILVELDSLQNVLCFGDSTGLLYTTSTGGTGTLSGIWNTGQTADSISQLPAAVYFRTTTDGNGCEVIDSFTIAQPEQIISNDSIIHNTCSNDNVGAIYLNATGGIGALNYAWSNSSTMIDLVNMNSGVYKVTLTDQNLCEQVDSFTINYTYLALIADLGMDTAICEGDSAVLSSEGVAATYLWSTGDTSNLIVVNSSGQYSVNLIDSNGCSDQDSINVSVNPLPVFTLGDDIYICDDSIINGLTLFGPSNMNQYMWLPGGEATQIKTITDTGSYNLWVTDSNGCEYYDQIYVVDDTCLGIDPLATQLNVSVFPNPTRGVFNIQTDYQKPLEMRILNSNGQLVLNTQMIQEDQFDLRSNGAGIYFIELIDETHHWNLRVVVLE